MPTARKNITRKKTKKTPTTVVVVTKTYHKAGETLFPEKVAKVKDILSRSDYHPSEE
jgi:hypothetical protein